MKSGFNMKNSFLVFVMLSLSWVVKAQEIATMTLEQSIHYALDNAYQMDYANMDVELAHRQNKELTAIGLPQINGDVSFTNYLKLPTTAIPANAFDPTADPDEVVGVQFGTKFNASASLNASQMLFDGTYFIGLKAAKAYIALNESAKQQSENELRKSITEAYGLAVLSVESHRIFNENYNSLEALLKDTEALFENGFREELDVDQLRLQLAGLDNRRKQSERNVQVTHNLLKFQMGMPIAQELVLSSSLSDLAGINVMPELLQSDIAVDGHTDVRTTESNVELRRLNVQVEKMAGVPKLHAFLTTQQQAFRQDLSFFGNESEWYPGTFWGLQLQVPIFSGFMRHNKVQKAKIDHQRALLQRDQVREGVLLEIATQRSNYATALDVFDTEQNNVTLAEKINRVTRTKYEEGLSSSFEIQQAETQMLDAQGRFLQAAFDLIQSKAALEKALDIKN